MKGILGRHWESDGRESLSPRSRLVLSILVTGAVGFVLEYVGTEVLYAFRNSNPNTLYVATAIWALVVGPLLVVYRRSSVLVPMLIVGLGFGVIVLMNHYWPVRWQLVDGVWQSAGLSTPRTWEFTDGRLFGISNPLLLASVAGIVQSLVVPVSVLIQKALTFRKTESIRSVSLEDQEEFFGSSFSSLQSVRVRRDFGYYVMRFIAIAYGVNLAYEILGLIVNGRDLPLVKLYFLNPPATVNSFMKLSLMMLLANLGAYNRTIRRPVAVLLAIGHSCSVAAALWLYFGYPASPSLPEDHAFVGLSAAGDGVLILLLLAIAFLNPNERSLPLPEEDRDLDSPASNLLRAYFLVFSVMFTAFTLAIVGFRAFSSPYSAYGAVFGFPDALVINSLTKYGTLASLGWTMFLIPSLRRFLVPVVTTSFAISLAVTIIYALQGTTRVVTRIGTVVDVPWFMVWHIIVDGCGLALLFVLRQQHYNSDFQIIALSPGGAECAMALHRAFRFGPEFDPAGSRETLRRIDEHMVGIRGPRRGLIGIPFGAMEYVLPIFCWFRPHFSTMSTEEQRFMIRRHVLRPPWERLQAPVPGFADLAYRIGDTLHALVTFAYYSSPIGQREVGYVLPDARPRLQGPAAIDRPPARAIPEPLPESVADGLAPPPSSFPDVRHLAPRIGAPQAADKFLEETDFLVIGSGAAGAVVAHRLSLANQGARICILERGGYFRPSVDFTDDEMAMYRMLYAEGGLQTTRRMDFAILQGECVGGSTVVNNAVCVRMPDVSRREWEENGIDLSPIDAHYRRVAEEINIETLKPMVVNSRVEALIRKGIQESFDPAASRILRDSEILQANVLNCVGCGLCTLGCRRLRKLSMLETYVTWARARGVHVIAGTGAVCVETQRAGFGMKAVTNVIARRSDGSFKKIRVKRAVVLCAGAVASSRFLLRSGVGGEEVGRNMSCNFGVAPIVQFEETLDAFDGFQMFLSSSSSDYSLLFEPTFNPPGAYSIGIALHAERHRELMNGYRNAVNFTALVGSEPGGVVSRRRDPLFGRAVEWTPGARDLINVREALKALIRIGRAAGATRIYLPTQPGVVVPLDGRDAAASALMNQVLRDPRYFSWFTAHPQGGNCMSGNGHVDRVVEVDFRVKGCTNLYVCDASIFPRSIRVNPQWTIMALASIAGERISAG
jgi:choline dehydrogenase-like flavoprotein